MIDVLGFYVALIVWAIVAHVAAVWRTRPSLLYEDAGTLDRNQATYERGVPRRLAWRVALVGTWAYFLLRGFLFPSGESLPRWVIEYALLSIIVAYVASATGATLARHRLDRRFAERHPQFAEGVAPLGYRLLPLGVVGAPLIGLGLSLVDDGPRSLGYIVIGVGLEFVFLVLLRRARRRSAAPLLPDSSLGQKIAAVVATFGKPPKGVVTLRSMVANGYAWADGTVYLTTALRAVATEDEIAALVAHEMSHVRDGDARWIRSAWLLAAAVSGAMAGGLAFAIGERAVSGLYVVPVGLLTFLVGLMLGRMVIVRQTAPLEYKCDADATALGLAEAMASVLVKIHALNGLPRRIAALDRPFSTHPSLDDRLARLSRETEGRGEA